MHHAALHVNTVTATQCPKPARHIYVVFNNVQINIFRKQIMSQSSFTEPQIHSAPII